MDIKLQETFSTSQLEELKILYSQLYPDYDMNFPLEEFIQKTDYNLLVAYLDNKIVGLAGFRLFSTIRLSASTMKTRTCYLDDLVILNGYRRKGFGKKLIGHLTEYCRTQNVNEIFLMTSGDLKFYKKEGFEDSTCMMKWFDWCPLFHYNKILDKFEK